MAAAAVAAATRSDKTVSPAGDYVRLSPTAVAVVDTPIFQRLRFLKQLGMTGALLCVASVGGGVQRVRQGP